jgi:hypothetical protein
MFKQTFRKAICAALSTSILASTVLAPVLTPITAQAQAAPVVHKYKKMCSINNCFFESTVPLPVWTEVGQLHNPLGNARTAEEHRRLTKGPAIFTRDAPWAAILGLNSDEVVYDLWLKRTGGAPWVIARYVPEKAQLRVSLIKVIRTTEGTQRVLISDWTPEMGKWDIPRRSFLSDNEAYFLGNKGYDPFLPFKASETDPMFYNIGPDAAQVVIGRAMAHHSAPYAMLIENQIRYDQSTSKSGNFLRKKITTTTKGYVTPKFYIALPPAFSPAANTGQAVPMAVICPRPYGCSDEKHLAWAGVYFEEARGGIFPQIEEQLYTDVESKTSWTTLAFALVTGALTWGMGAIAAGDAAWALDAGGNLVSGASTEFGTSAISGSTVSGGVGIAYVGINTIINGGSPTSPQAGWFGETGWRIQDVPTGISNGSYCTNKHCQAMYERTVQRHLDTPAPGMPGAEANLDAVVNVVQGVCPVSWTAAQCDAAGQASGMMPRADSYDPRPRSSPEIYEHNRASCVAAGYGQDKRKLNRCLVTGVEKMQR